MGSSGKSRDAKEFIMVLVSVSIVRENRTSVSMVVANTDNPRLTYKHGHPANTTCGITL